MQLYNNRRKYIPGGTITRKSLETAVVTLPQNSYTYTGEAISPTPTVRLDGVLLAANEDYTVAYVNNTDLGLATVAVTGIDKYYGTAAAEFYITSAASTMVWDFDVQKIPATPQFAELTDSSVIWDVCPSQDESLLLVGTGSGKYARVGSWRDFNPSTFVQTGITSSGVESQILHTPDGIHYLTGGVNVVQMRIASSEYDMATIPSSIDSYYSRNYINGACISPDGTHVLMSCSYGSVSPTLVSMELATPWNLGSYTNVQSVNVDTSGPIFVNLQNGRQIAIAGSPSYGVKDISLITLNTAWDVSDGIASTSTKTLDLSTVTASAESYLKGIAINKAGTKMVVTLTDSNKAQAALINLSA